MRRLAAVVVLMVLSLCVTATAGAEEDPKKMFEAATAEFNLGHYVKAAAMYEDIYKITLQPVLLYNIGQAHRLAGDLEKASFFYKGYLRAQPQARNHTEVERRIVELDLAIAAKKRTQERPPNAPATVDARKPHVASTPPEPSSQPRTSPPPPVTTEPSPSAPSPATNEPAQPAATEPLPVAADTSAATASTDVASDKPIWKKWWFWTIIGGVVVVGVVVAVAVVATQAPSFNATLPETGPGAHALTTSSRTAPAQTVKLLEVQF